MSDLPASELITFVSGTRQLSENRWFDSGPVSFYLRNTNRFLSLEIKHSAMMAGSPIYSDRLSSLDIANVSVSSEFRGQGFFTEILATIEGNSPHQIIYVENILSIRFAQFFHRRGYFVFTPYGNICAYRLNRNLSN